MTVEEKNVCSVGSQFYFPSSTVETYSPYYGPSLVYELFSVENIIGMVTCPGGSFDLKEIKGFKKGHSLIIFVTFY